MILKNGITPTCKDAVNFLNKVADLLQEKNQKYGDSAANPLRLFSQASPVEQLLVRIDDKLSRLKTMGPGASPDEDTLMDLVGYLALLAAVRSEQLKDVATKSNLKTEVENGWPKHQKTEWSPIKSNGV